MPAMAEKSLTPTSCSQSNAAHGVDGGAGGRGGGGGTRAALGAGGETGGAAGVVRGASAAAGLPGCGGAMTGGSSPGVAGMGRAGAAGCGVAERLGSAGGDWRVAGRTASTGAGGAGRSDPTAAAFSAWVSRRRSSSMVRRCVSSDRSSASSLVASPICFRRLTIGRTAMARPISVRSKATTPRLTFIGRSRRGPQSYGREIVRSTAP